MVRKLIQDKLEELRITRKELSAELGRDPGYMSQFLVRGVPEELDERDRVIIARVLEVPEESLRGPSAVLPKRRYQKKAPRENLVDHPPHPPHHATQGSQRPIAASELFAGTVDLPVFGTAQGGEGTLTVTEQAVDWTERPRILLRVDDAYGMIVTGDSMDPLIKPGSTVLVHPHIPPRVGDFCVFRSKTQDGTRLAAIKEYRGESETAWRVRQYNPPKDFNLKKSEWQERHKVMTINLP